MAETGEIPKVNPWIIALAVMTATFMEVLDTTVVNVSLPHIAGSLSVTIDEGTWALTSYLVANAVILPMTGWLANFFGRKRLLMTSVVGFTMASFFCGFAPNLATLVMFRIIQGATGGALQPLSQAVLLEAFPAEARGKAMGFWGLGIVVAPIMGPVLGGWLTDNYSWRWIFYVNVPVGLVSLAMIRRFIFDPPYIRRSSQRVDGWGIGMLAIGIAALQLVLDKGQQEDWFESSWIIGMLILAIAMLVAFIIREFRVGNPILHLRVFKNRTYAAGVVLMTTLGFVLYGSLVLLPIFLQTLLGYSAAQAGIVMSPRGIGSFIAMPLVGILTTKIDPRKLLATGLIGGAATLYQLSTLNLNAGYWDFFWPQFFQGLAMGLTFVPLTTVTMSLIKREDMGNATSIFNLMRNLGGSVGIAVVATMLARGRIANSAMMGSNISIFDPEARSMFEGLRAYLVLRGWDLTTATQGAQAMLSGLLSREAAMLSFVTLFRLLAIVFVALMPLLLIMKRPKQVGRPGPGH